MNNKIKFCNNKKDSEKIPDSKMMKPPEAPPEGLTISDRAESQQAPINFKEAIEEFEGDREIFFKILEKFMQNVKTQVEAMQKALLSQDAGKLKTEAHSIKGGAANLTAAPLAAIAAELEETARSGQLERAPDIFKQFKEEFQHLEAYVSDHLKDLSQC
jgi:HPt (histidine-containing phosphotransfer) domain-containing protein